MIIDFKVLSFLIIAVDNIMASHYSLMMIPPVERNTVIFSDISDAGHDVSDQSAVVPLPLLSRHKARNSHLDIM